MHSLLGLFLFSVLLKTGTSLECEVCSGFGSSCTGVTQTCAAGQDTCATILSENSLTGEKMITSVKACEYSAACHVPPTHMTLGQGKSVRSSVTCCTGDACGTAAPQFPPAMDKPNGKRCPACYAFSFFPASPVECGTETVACVGVEDYCLDMVEAVTYGNYVMHIIMKGCVTKDVCDAKGFKSTSEGTDIHITKLKCSQAS
ncbi:phospholipase A2 inhibitor NAI-like [Varanus komodoensis]|uniref:phospholipase A2 inhibitor NAI-like n=1 Tax=Varanus komodoensis TaxID=61221 RepID=UPI001CF7A2A1|nr:phospholipase A2 inhibitor NAI-like [Varanus komodoensis]XP_044290882.1 phospholipase A2 inhibitor NAI-like [Varanus komodoensis]XP_044290883.1 phospholipase A2 inhibitor NAI-like [Varanus komodoensis]XP_044290884.1 phospholipase A2 inhibitor NAI-like [Varanus komodoensis]